VQRNPKNFRRIEFKEQRLGNYREAQSIRSCMLPSRHQILVHPVSKKSNLDIKCNCEETLLCHHLDNKLESASHHADDGFAPTNTFVLPI